MAKAQDLKGLFPFQRLQESELALLADMIVEKTYGTGQTVFQEGDPSSSLYVVRSGTVEIVKQVDGREQVLATLSEGDFFGEMALFEFAPRSADVRVALEATIFEITKDQFDQLVLAEPAIAARVLYNMMEDMSRRVRKASGAAQQHSFF